MRIGMTGHQEREGLDWDWTRDALRDQLAALPSPLEGWSSLAIGADQLFAALVLDTGGSLVAVIPGPWYADCFTGAGLERYRTLRARSRVVELDEPEGDAAFLAAGIRVADAVDLLFAVWDGEPAEGAGGTADIVAHARAVGRPVIHLDPFTRSIRTL